MTAEPPGQFAAYRRRPAPVDRRRSPGPRDAAKPWLSVVMPLHDGERWIDAALQSLCADGDARGIEVLILDSSPTAATLDRARAYEDRLDIRVLRHDLLMWHAKTNLGTRAARADHVCWLHQDDLWLPGRAAAIRGWIDAAPDAVLHLAPSAIVDGAGRRLGFWRCPFAGECELDREQLVARLLVQCFVAAPAPVYRRDAWAAAGGLDEQLWYTADWDIWLKLAGMGPVRHHDAATTAFRIHGGSLTVAGSRDAADFERQLRTVLDRHLPKLGPRSHGMARGVERAGRASIRVNTALAAAARGDLRGLMPAIAQVLGLGPAGTARYLRDSRLLDRVVPRVRAKLEGSF